MRLILVIDPAHVFTHYVELVVGRYGYGIKGVHSAGEALEALASERIDLVIAQEKLPDMTWPQFCQAMEVATDRTGVPVLVLSADPDNFDDRGCKGITVAGVRTRPISIRDLITAIQKHLPFRNKRAGIRAPVPVQAAIREGNEFIPCQILNLSEGGAFIMRKEPFPIGADVNLHLLLEPGETPLKVAGRVVYVVKSAHSKKPRGMGIKFDELQADVREKLHRYLDRHVSAILGK